MASVRDDLESFHQFAAQQLASGVSSATLDELFIEWHDNRALADINESIRRGLADVEADRYAPAHQAMESIRQKFDFESE